MRKKLSEHDQWLLGLLDLKPGVGREHSAILAKLRGLLRIIMSEADLAAALAPGGRLSLEVRRAAGLERVFESLVRVQSAQTRYRTVGESGARERLILLELQNDELRRRNQSLPQRCDEYDEQQNGGVRWYQGLQYYAAQTPAAREEADRAIAQAKEQYRQRKAREIALEQRAMLRRQISRRREELDEPLPMNWFANLAVSDPTELCGYVQATGVPRKRINTFLKSIRAAACAHRRSDKRGRPLPLYPFAINLRVLDQWLGVWLPPDADRIGHEVMTTLLWCMAKPHTPEQAAALRQVLAKHLARVRGRITDPDLTPQVRRWSTALNSEAGWQRMIPSALRTFRDAEMRLAPEERREHAALADPLMAIFSGVASA
jgi:hypothetical protein